MQCPLKFRYQVVDGRRQPPTEATVKGTVVHQVLDNLFELPPNQRTLENSKQLLPKAWGMVLETDSQAAELFTDPDRRIAAVDDTEDLVANYFSLEVPENLRPRGREHFIDVRLPSGVLLRGIVDRIDESAEGSLRVIDYKTGRAPNPRFVDDALFQMRFYALMLEKSWRLPARLQLLYLRSLQVLTLDPEARDIEAFEQQVNDLWERIKQDARSGDFSPRQSKLCGWCPFQQDCPVFGGTVSPAPASGLEKLLTVEKAS